MTISMRDIFAVRHNSNSDLQCNYISLENLILKFNAKEAYFKIEIGRGK